MRAMIAANDDRPSFAHRYDGEIDGSENVCDDAPSGRDWVPSGSSKKKRASCARIRTNPEASAHRLQPRFPSAIQPVRLGRGEVARIPELMRVLDRRTAKK